MSVLSASYGIVDARKVEPSRPKLVKLPRPVAQELVLLSVLCPLSFCDLSAPVSTRVYATEMRLNIRVVMCLPIWAWTWLGYSGGLLRSEAVASGLLKRLRFEDPEPFELRATQGPGLQEPERPSAFFFEFIEVCGGSGRVTAARAALASHWPCYRPFGQPRL